MSDQPDKLRRSLPMQSETMYLAIIQLLHGIDRAENLSQLRASACVEQARRAAREFGTWLDAAIEVGRGELTRASMSAAPPPAASKEGG